MNMKMEYNAEDSGSIWKSFFSTWCCLRLVKSVLNQHEAINRLFVDNFAFESISLGLFAFEWKVPGAVYWLKSWAVRKQKQDFSKVADNQFGNLAEIHLLSTKGLWEAEKEWKYYKEQKGILKSGWRDIGMEYTLLLLKNSKMGFKDVVP